jgi:hypothetical protein
VIIPQCHVCKNAKFTNKKTKTLDILVESPNLNLQPVLVLHILTDRYENKYRKGRLEINETNADKIYYIYLQYIDS